MSDYPMLISNKLHSFRNFVYTKVLIFLVITTNHHQNVSHRCQQHQSCNFHRLYPLWYRDISCRTPARSQGKSRLSILQL